MHLRRKTVCSCVLQTSLFPPGDAPLGGMQGTPLPNPSISFHLWTEDDQLCECPGGLRQVWMVPEAGKPVQNKSFSPDSWAVSFITTAPRAKLVEACADCTSLPSCGVLGSDQGISGGEG